MQHEHLSSFILHLSVHDSPRIISHHHFSELNSPKFEALIQKSESLDSLKSRKSESSKSLKKRWNSNFDMKKPQKSKSDDSLPASLEQVDSIPNSYSESFTQDFEVKTQEKDEMSADVMENVQSDNGSKLNPLKTSRSMSSMDDVDDLMRSSNESFGRLGYKKPVLGAESKVKH